MLNITPYFSNQYWKRIIKLEKESTNLYQTKDIQHQKESQQFIHIKHPKSVTNIAIFKQEMIATACLDKIIRIYNFQGEFLKQFENSTDSDKELCFSFDGKFLITCGSYERKITVWNLENHNQHQQILCKSKPLKVKYFNNNSYNFVSASQNNELDIWNRQGINFNNLKGHNNQITVIELSDDNFRCITASSDGIIIEWDIQNMKLLKRIYAHKKGCFTLKYGAKRQLLISAGGDKRIKIWCLAKYRLISQLLGHTEGIYSIDINSNNNIISCTAHQINIWKYNKFTQITNSQLNYCFISVIEDKQFITGCNDGIKIWKQY